MIWVITGTVNAPEEVVSARNGASAFFAAYSRLIDQWYWIYPGGEQKIPEPEMLFLEETWAKANRSLGKIYKVEKSFDRRRKSAQLLLNF